MVVKNLEKVGFAQNWNSGVFEVTDQNFLITLSKFEMSAKGWWLKIWRKA